MTTDYGNYGWVRTPDALQVGIQVAAPKASTFTRYQQCMEACDYDRRCAGLTVEQKVPDLSSKDGVSNVVGPKTCKLVYANDRPGTNKRSAVRVDTTSTAIPSYTWGECNRFPALQVDISATGAGLAKVLSCPAAEEQPPGRRAVCPELGLYMPLCKSVYLLTLCTTDNIISYSTLYSTTQYRAFHKPMPFFMCCRIAAYPAVCREMPKDVVHGKWPLACAGQPPGFICQALCDCSPEECYSRDGCPTTICQADGNW